MSARGAHGPEFIYLKNKRVVEPRISLQVCEVTQVAISRRPHSENDLRRMFTHLMRVRGKDLTEEVVFHSDVLFHGGSLCIDAYVQRHGLQLSFFQTGIKLKVRINGGRFS